MKNFIITLIFIAQLPIIYCQESFEKKHYATIGVSNLLNYKVRFQGQGVFMQSKLAYSPEINFGYIFDFSKKWRLNTKINFGVTSHNLNYEVNPLDNSIFKTEGYYYDILKTNFTDYGQSYYFSSDISFQRKFGLKNNDNILLGFGFRTQYYVLNYFELGIGSTYYVSETYPQVDFFDAVVGNENLSPINFAANIELGYLLKLKRNNDLKISFFYNYAFSKRMEGRWEFKNIDIITAEGILTPEGILFQKPSFFGLLFEYQINFSKFLNRK